MLSCKQSSIPLQLQGYPIGIVVEHDKQEVFAESVDRNGVSTFKWNFATTVKADKEELKIVEFGAYQFTGDGWVQQTIYDRPFNSDEFSNWYECPNSILEEGVAYTDHNNWAISDSLDGLKKRALWYYIGENKNGEQFIGMAELVMVGEIR